MVAERERVKGNPDDGGQPNGADTDKDGNGFDDHSDWGDSDGTDEKRKIAEERLKESIKEAFVEAQSKGYGSVSRNMRRTIKEAITPKVNWRGSLAIFCQSISKSR